MKLQTFGVFAVMTGSMLMMIGCGHQQQVPSKIGTATLTMAPMVPDRPLPPELMGYGEDELAEPAEPAVETWGVRPPTDQELEEFGF